ncbi:hypothetical protein ABNF97_09465 [Plantactinospora sp. B6F1]|uniref:hypothetical protein n=1 Tax=Plantactinospora sp. B6F1 TaxID=3158971 RepID=UPI0032D93996
MAETTICMPCRLGTRPALSSGTPHDCPGSVIVGDGAETVAKLCACPTCWPNGLPPLPPPLRLGPGDGSPLG